VAAVLAAAGRPEEAARLLENQRLDPDDYAQFINLAAGRKSWTAAEEWAKKYQAAYPDDLRATRMLADVYSWWGEGHTEEALRLYRDLDQKGYKDPDPRGTPVAVRIAETTLWGGEPAKAMGLFADLLKKDPNDPAAQDGFLAAVAGYPEAELPAEAKGLAGRLLAKLPTTKWTDPAKLARAAQVRVKLRQMDDAKKLLALAVKQPLADPAARRELAGAFAAAGLAREGLKLYPDGPVSPADQELVADLYAAAKDWGPAEELLTKLREKDPENDRLTLRLARVLGGKGDYKQAAELSRGLLAKKPGDLALAVETGQIELAAKRYNEALGLFAGLLADHFANADVRKGFVDAAAAATNVSADHVALAARVANDPATAKSGSIPYLARLAWVLIQFDTPGPVTELLDRAVSLTKTSTLADRRELAGVLAAANRGKEALDLFGKGEVRPEDLYARANIYASNKLFREAIADCREYLKAAPDDLNAELLLANLHSWNRDFDEALVEFDRLKAKYPDDKRLPVRAAETTLWAKRPDEALDLFTAILEADPNQPKAVPGFIGSAVEADALTAAAVAVADRLRAGLPTAPEQFDPRAGLAGGAAAGWVALGESDPLKLARLGYVFRQARKGDIAVRLMDDAVAAIPATAALRAARGAAETEGAKADARVRSETAAMLDIAGRPADAAALRAGLPFDAGNLYATAQVYASVNGFKAAIAELRAILAKEPANRPARRLLADCLTWDRQFVEGLDLLRRLLAEQPGDPDLPARIAQTLVWDNKPDQAVLMYRGLLSKDPGRPKLVRGLVEAAAALGTLTKPDADEVARLYAEVPILRQIAEPVFVARLGRALQLAGLRDEADKAFDRAVAAPPRSARGRADLAAVLAEAGRADAAIALIESIKPEPADYVRLTGAFTGKKDWPAAERAARAFVAAYPDDPAAVRQLADVLSWWDADHRQESLALFAKLVAADPTDADNRLRYAEVRQWTGDNAGAVPGFVASVGNRAAAAVAGAAAAPGWWGYDQARRLDADARTTAGFAAAAGTEGLNTPAVDLAGRLLAVPAVRTNALVAGRLTAVLYRAGRPLPAGAVDRFLLAAPKLAAESPDQRREVAGLLSSLGRAQSGLDLYAKVAPEPADRQLLAGLYLSTGNTAAAEREAAALLAANPADPAAEQLMAEILAAKKEFSAARDRYLALVAARPRDVRLNMALARMDMALKQWEFAAARLAAVLEIDPDAAAAKAEFVNAAAAAKKLTEKEVALAVRIAEDPETLEEDAVHLARLSWVLIREKAPGPVKEMLDQAIKLDPSSRADRKELAGVLAAAERGEDALKMFGNVPPDGAEDHFLLANIHATRKDFNPALKNVREYLKLRPEDPEAKGRRLLADVLSYARFFDEALVEFDKLRALVPDDKTVPVRIAETTLWDDRAADALEQFTRLLDLDPNQPQAVAGFAAAAFELAEVPTESLVVAEKVLAAMRSKWTGAGVGAGGLAGGWAVGQPDDPLVLARLGYLFHKADRDDLADPLFVRAALLVPRGEAEARTRWELGGILDVADWPKLADGVWAGLKVPADPEDTYKLALVYAAVRDFEGAIEVCREMLRVKPDYRKGERLLADCLTWDRQYDEGLRRLEKLLRETPDDPDLPTRIAQTYVWMGRPAEALARYKAELLKHWGRPKLIRGMIEAAAAMNAIPEDDARLVVKAYREFKDSPTLRRVANPVFVARLGRVLQLVGLPDDANRELDEAQRATPRGTRDRRELAGVLADAGRVDAALKLFEGLPPSVDDYRRLAYLNSGRQNWPAAVKAAKAYVDAFPDDPAALRTLADVLSWWGEGHRKEALAIFAKLVARDPADPGLRLRVAEVRLWEGDAAGALPAFTAVLAGPAVAAVAGGAAAPGWDPTAAQPPAPGELVKRAAAGFAAAVGGVESAPPAAVDLAAGLLRDWPAGQIDPLSAARLSAALNRARRPVPPGVVERFLVAAPDLAKAGPGERREVAGLLGTFGQPQAGLDLFRGVAPTQADIPLLAGLFLAAKNYPAAEQQARALLVQFPGDPTAERLLADILAAQGKYDLAVKTYERLAATDPGNVRLLTGLGRLLQAQNLPDKAAARLLAALDLDYNLLDVRTDFVNAVAGLPAGRLSDAEMAFAIRLAEDPETLRSDDPVYLSRLAYVLVREKAPGPVNALLDRAVALDPQNQDPRKELAGVLAAADRGRDALKVFGEVRLDHPEDRITLANILSSLGDFPAAVREVLAYLVVKPGDPAGERLLADLRSYGGEFDEALTSLEALLAKTPADKVLPVRIAETLLWSGRAAEALARFTRILATDLNQPQAIAGFVNAAFQTAPVPADSLAVAEAVRARLGAGWAGGGTPAGAVGGVLAVGRTDDPLLVAKLGYVLTKANRPAEADALFARAALLASGDDGRVRWELGGVLEVAGRPAAAQAVWAGLPFHPGYLYRLAQVYAAARDFPRAVAEARKLLVADPNDRRAKRLLADSLTWNKEWDAGLSLLRELQLLTPDDPDLTARVAETLVWSGHPADALRTYSEALRKTWGRPRLVRGFVEAVADLPAAERLAAGDLELLNRIVREFPALAQGTDPVFTARYARALQAAGRADDAARLFDRVLAADLTDPRVRRALAPLLAAGGRVEDAERMFQGVTPEPDDYPQLAYLFAARKNWAEAERFAQRYKAAFPNDPRAGQLLADVLSWWGGKDRHAESLKLFDELLKANPGDKGLLLRAAEVKQWSGNFVRAAEEFAALLRAGGLTEPQAVRAREGLLAAAAGALASPTSLTVPTEYADVAEGAARGLPPAAADPDPVRAARIAVILSRAGRTADVPGLVARATAVPAVRLAPDIRRDLAGLLGVLKRWDEAVALLKSVPELTLDDRFNLAGLYAAAEKFADAEREARLAIESAPKDPRAARLLANVLSWKKDYTDAIRVYEKLIAENPEDLDLKRSLATVLLYAGKYAESADRFVPLLDPDPGAFPMAADFIAALANVNEPKPAVLKLAAKVGRTQAARDAKDPTFLSNMAWVLRRATDRAEGEKFLDLALGLVRATGDSAAKKNLAGVLETYGRKKDAIGLFQGLELTADDRLRLAGLYAAEAYDDKTSYDPTIAQCRAILEADPGNLKAKRLLADALSWNAVRTETPPKVSAAQFKESLALFRELAVAGYTDPKAEKFVPNNVRIAEATLWSKAYDDAVGLYRAILSERFEQPDPDQTLEVWRGFIDAAASAKDLTPADRALVRRIADRMLDDPKTSVARLSRMAWVLFKSDPAMTKNLLDAAVERVAKTPTVPEFRRELAGVLSSVGRYAEARLMYDGLELTYQDRLRIAQIYTAESDFAAAEARIRAVLRERPDDKPTKLLLADVLTYGRKFPEAIRTLEGMRLADPGNPVVVGKLATALLYNGEPARSLALLTPLLTENVDQPDLWAPYLETVSLSTGAPASARGLVDEIYARMQADPQRWDSGVVLRLAGGALARSGRAERAVALLRQAVAAKPDDQVLRERYADVLHIAGRFDEAQQQYDIILQQKARRPRPAPPPPPAAGQPTDANAGGAARPGRPAGTTVARPR
jgi:predicted Zn-dependent protease